MYADRFKKNKSNKHENTDSEESESSSENSENQKIDIDDFLNQRVKYYEQKHNKKHQISDEDQDQDQEGDIQESEESEEIENDKTAEDSYYFQHFMNTERYPDLKKAVKELPNLSTKFEEKTEERLKGFVKQYKDGTINQAQ